MNNAIDIYLDSEKKDIIMPEISVLCDKDKFINRGYKRIPSLVDEVEDIFE